jgi:hypothetical protein
VPIALIGALAGVATPVLAARSNRVAVETTPGSGRGVRHTQLQENEVAGIATTPRGVVKLGQRADALTADEAARAAVVSPLADILDFGAVVGFPLVCQTGLSVPVIVSSQIPGAAPIVGPVVSEVGRNLCIQGSQTAGEFIAQLQQNSAPLAAINPVVNPALDGLADATTQAAITFGPSIEPFGGTVAELSADIRFFKGS